MSLIGKPILFNTDMVRAILDKRKTVTRRIVKPQPFMVEQPENTSCWCGHFVSENGKVLVDKPPYQSGDILYVRETWAKIQCSECEADDCESYIERNGLTIFCNGEEYVYKATDLTSKPIKWRPSIHMPKEAARIFLRVTSVRVERLQEIAEEQAVSEGCLPGGEPVSGGPWGVEDDPGEWTAREMFLSVWDSTIKPADRALYGWEANPWVWVIEFERISREEALKNA